jgi:hypothetical protein
MTAPLVAISDIIHNGIVFDFKNWGLERMHEDDLKSMVERLFSLLEERRVDYVLVGGVALLQYVEGRNTQDIDLIMATSSLERVPEIELIRQDENFARSMFEGLQIDILLTRNPLFARIQQAHTTSRPFTERTVKTATVQGLVLLKLYALPSLYRQGDFTRVGLYENDVATLLYAYQLDDITILNELKSFVSATDLEEIRNIMAELRGRFSRLGR